MTAWTMNPSIARPWEERGIIEMDYQRISEAQRLAEMQLTPGERIRKAIDQMTEIKTRYSAARSTAYRENRRIRDAEVEIAAAKRQAMEQLRSIYEGISPLLQENNALDDELFYASQNLEIIGAAAEMAREYNPEGPQPENLNLDDFTSQVSIPGWNAPNTNA